MGGNMLYASVYVAGWFSESVFAERGLFLSVAWGADHRVWAEGQK